MKCVECCYYWKEEDEGFAHCQWQAKCGGDMAPCEEETDWAWVEEDDHGADWDVEDSWDETGFDPYTGSYTWDC